MTHLRINLKTICANFGPVYGQMFSTGDSVHDVEQCLNISTVSHITTNSQTLSDNFQENANIQQISWISTRKIFSQISRIFSISRSIRQTDQGY